MEYLVILTLELPGQASVTTFRIVMAGADSSRIGLLLDMKRYVVSLHGARFEGAVVTYFSAEPNQLAGIAGKQE